jgi:hypothetical protein
VICINKLFEFRSSIHYESGLHDHLKKTKVKFHIKVGAELIKLGKELYPEIDAALNEFKKEWNSYDWRLIQLKDTQSLLMLYVYLIIITTSLFIIEISFYYIFECINHFE